jgi:hypothetical protein
MAAGAETAFAQVAFDAVGARALGMAGAFVAVADDSSADFWNPAGLVKGPLAGLTIGADEFHIRHLKGPIVPGAARLTTKSVAFSAWPVGISFLRMRTTAISEDAAGALRATAIETAQLGFTVLQSIGDFVVAGGTVKYVRGKAAFGPANGHTTEEALDAAAAAPADSASTFDFDVGVLAGSDRVRVGVAFKNLRRPRFDTIGGKTIFLERKARFGLAAFPRDGLTLAIDVDLDTADPLVGLRRTIALGGENRLGVRLALRGGIRWRQGEVTRPIGALGGSVLIGRGLWLDGYFTRSYSGGTQGFGLALRAGS